MKPIVFLAVAAMLLPAALAIAPTASAESDLPCYPSVPSLVKCAMEEACYFLSGNRHCLALTGLPDPHLLP